MLTNISEDLKKIFLFGVGAMAMTAEKSKVIIDELVAKGELTVEQGKVLNEELIHNIKETIKDNATAAKPEPPATVDAMTANLDKMTDDDLQALKEKIELLEKAKAAKQAAYTEKVYTSNDEDQ
ncbi:MAG: phasin family protein [Acetobacterium sp.]